MARLLAIASLVAVGVLIACGGQSSTEDSQATLQELAGQIDRIIGDAACTLTDQCRVIAVGSKPCGGPWSYRAYSTVNTDVPTLETTMTRHNTLQAELNRRTAAVSDCMFVTEPQVQCLTGKCVAH